MNAMKKIFLAICTVLLSGSAIAADPYPTVRLKDLPAALKEVWKQTKPEMTDRSRCAAAFDASGDMEKMSLQCSVHIRMAAEGARRAMRYCEEKRAELKIKDVCRIVVE